MTGSDSPQPIGHPGRARPQPVAAYRMQLHAGAPFSAAGARLDYLRRLGVSHLYTSPVLSAVEGSTHYYDGVDPTEVSPALGGTDGLARLVDELHRHGLGWLVDIVPNHLSVRVPMENPWWWAALRDGRGSGGAELFDVDWEAGAGHVVIPVLSRPLTELAADGLIGPTRARGELAVSVDGYVVPLRPGSTPPVNGPGAAQRWLALLAEQHYRLVPWRDGGRNYRVFFDIDDLAAVRVEDPVVFDLVHRQLAAWVEQDWVDGARVDHVDGLAAPGPYLDRLRLLLGPDRWLLVEKILLGDEDLPPWPVDGTTGYELAALLARVLTDPEGERSLTDELTGVSGGETPDYERIEADAKLEAAQWSLQAATGRLARLAGVEPEAVAAAISSLDVYRTYLPAGGEGDRARLKAAFARASADHPRRRTEIDLLAGMVLAPASPVEVEVRRRLQQLTGPVMAKGAEDTAFYRYHRLVAHNDVGSDPSWFSAPVEDLHRWAIDRQARLPRSLLTTSTHDTKRSGDVRARLVTLSEQPERWREAVARWRTRLGSSGLDGPTGYLFWQTLVGAWPIGPERLASYLIKAAREDGTATNWTDPVADYEAALADLAQRALADAGLMDEVGAFVADHLLVPGRINGLTQQLLRCTLPGVPDIYQGCEVWDLSLVDPDNRRTPDWDQLEALLDRCGTIDGRAAWGEPDDGLPKLFLLTRTLHLRRRLPRSFGLAGTYRPLVVTPASGPALSGGQHRGLARAAAFERGDDVVVVVPLRPVAVGRDGWGDEAVALPPGRWRDILCPDRIMAGSTALADLLAPFPVALLAREAETAD